MIMSEMPIETPALVASREAEFLQLIERLDRALLAGHLVAAPDDVAELLLARSLVEETEFFGQISLKMTRPAVVSMTRRVRVAVNRLLAEIRILEANPVVRFDRAIRHRELDFGRVGEERQTRFVCRHRRRAADSGSGNNSRA